MNLLNKAYYWYRPHPYFGELYPGKVLNDVSAPDVLRKYPYALQSKRFFPDGFSPHGLSMLYERKFTDSDFKEPVTELVFELVRKLYFPDAVSRLSCLYASETLEQAERWKNVFQEHLGEKENQTAVSLWEIEFEGTAKAYDAHFLSVPPENGFSFMQEMECAYNYWRGVRTYKPLLELLVPYPVIVSRLVKNGKPV